MEINELSMRYLSSAHPYSFIPCTIYFWLQVFLPRGGLYIFFPSSLMIMMILQFCGLLQNVMLKKYALFYFKNLFLLEYRLVQI